MTLESPFSSDASIVKAPPQPTENLENSKLSFVELAGKSKNDSGKDLISNRILEAAQAGLGKEVGHENGVPKNLTAAISVSRILKEAGQLEKESQTVKGLVADLTSPERQKSGTAWQKQDLKEARPGDLIVNEHHVGIVGKNDSLYTIAPDGTLMNRPIKGSLTARDGAYVLRHAEDFKGQTACDQENEIAASKILEASRNGLGKEIGQEDGIPKALTGALSVSRVLQEAGMLDEASISVRGLVEELSRNSWHKCGLEDARPGDLIVNERRIGIVGNDGQMFSTAPDGTWMSRPIQGSLTAGKGAYILRSPDK